MDRTYLFSAEQGELTVYNGKALLDFVVPYFLLATEDDYDIQVDGEYLDLFTFPGYESSYLKIYDSDERETLIKEFTSQVTRNSNSQVINASVSDMTFEANGKYYYELGYVKSGYEEVLRYGPLEVV